MQKENPQVSIKKMQQLASKEESKEIFFEGKIDGGLWFNSSDDSVPLVFTFKVGKGKFKCTIVTLPDGMHMLHIEAVLGAIPFTIEDDDKRSKALALKIKDFQPNHGEITLKDNKYFVLNASHEMPARDSALDILSEVAEHLHNDLSIYRTYFRVSLSVDNYKWDSVH